MIEYIKSILKRHVIDHIY